VKKDKRVKRFARSLLDSVGLDAAEGALNELGTLNGLMLKDRKFASLLIGPQFTDAEKSAVLQAVSGRLGLSEKAVRFVRHLIEEKAAARLDEVLGAARSLYLERKRMSKVTVYTPTPLDGGYEERLRASLKKIAQRDVQMECVTDPALLGGILVRVGSTMYDGSIKGQLRLLKDELVKG